MTQQTKRVVVVAALAAAVTAVLRRRQVNADADLLWREATSDSAR